MTKRKSTKTQTIDLENATQKTKDWATRFPQKGMFRQALLIRKGKPSLLHYLNPSCFLQVAWDLQINNIKVNMTSTNLPLVMTPW